jgi:hypothetical protein
MNVILMFVENHFVQALTSRAVIDKEIEAGTPERMHDYRFLN